jgi:hypothetical protein
MTEDEKGYSGWKNYETWAVKLWMDNEFYQEMTAAHVKDYGKDKAAYSLTGAIKDEIETNGPDLGASLYADLLGSALDNVDWREIAESLIEDLD